MKQVKPYLEHILQECNFLLEQSDNLEKEEFFKDSVLMRAFVRSLEIIGEAAKHIPNEFRNEHNSIQWKRIAGMRDVLIHEYFGIDYEIVWSTVKTEIPKLKEEIEKILLSTFKE